MSGYSDLEVSERFVGMGASGFIQKPFVPRDLSALVCRMVPSKADRTSESAQSVLIIR